MLTVPCVAWFCQKYNGAGRLVGHGLIPICRGKVHMYDTTPMTVIDPRDMEDQCPRLSGLGITILFLRVNNHIDKALSGIIPVIRRLLFL